MMKKIGLIVVLMLLFSGLCAQRDTTKSEWLVRRDNREEAQWKKQQQRMYAQAVASAQEVIPRKMENELWGVNDSQVTRAADSQILVLIPLREEDVPQWTGSAEKTAPASLEPRQMWWVSLDPQLSALLQDEPVMDSAALAVSVKQMLGLPPQVDYPYVATFWVSPNNLFRPTPNPDPKIHYSTTTFPEQVDPGHKKWIEQYRVQAYSGEIPHAWTQLGYAFDWGNPVRPVGVSEFVVKSKAPVRIASLATFWNWYTRQVDTEIAIPVEITE